MTPPSTELIERFALFIADYEGYMIEQINENHWIGIREGGMVVPAPVFRDKALDFYARWAFLMGELSAGAIDVKSKTE